MKTEQLRWQARNGWQPQPPRTLDHEAHLVLVFGSRALLQDPDRFEEIRRSYPQAILIGCSTAGEICDTQVFDDSLVVTSIHFEHSGVREAHRVIGSAVESYDVGRELAQALAPEGLRHAFVISDGLNVNGSELVRGLKSALPEAVNVTGGLSADGARFEQTMVAWQGPGKPGLVGLLGFYGTRLKIGYGSLGGWDPFGPERRVTRSDGNVLYELDGQSALGLYKRYLGEHASGLPATGLLFPLSVRTDRQGTAIVRTILSVDESRQSMTFAGDVPQGSYARLMRANFDRLVDGAAGAARTSAAPLGASAVDLAVLISCVGRKLVLKQRIEEEVESVREVLGQGPVLTGFYSYGEISPLTPTARCELHNQTMTITTFAEAA